MLRWLIAATAVHFWRPEIFENMVNPDFENHKHLQNLEHFYLTKGCIIVYIVEAIHILERAWAYLGDLGDGPVPGYWGQRMYKGVCHVC